MPKDNRENVDQEETVFTCYYSFCCLAVCLMPGSETETDVHMLLGSVPRRIGTVSIRQGERGREREREKKKGGPGDPGLSYCFSLCFAPSWCLWAIWSVIVPLDNHCFYSVIANCCFVRVTASWLDGETSSGDFFFFVVNDYMLSVLSTLRVHDEEGSKAL